MMKLGEMKWSVDGIAGCTNVDLACFSNSWLNLNQQLQHMHNISLQHNARGVYASQATLAHRCVAQQLAYTHRGVGVVRSARHCGSCPGFASNVSIVNLEPTDRACCSRGRFVTAHADVASSRKTSIKLLVVGVVLELLEKLK